MATNLLRLPLPPPLSLPIRPGKFLDVKYSKRWFPRGPRQRRSSIRRYCSSPGFLVSNSVEISTQSFEESSIDSVKPVTSDTPILLDVSGMMCGGCVARVKSVLMSDDRVASAVVNMLTETAAVRLKPEVVEVMEDAAESLAKRLTESGFEAKRRVSGMGVAENVKKWKEMVSKKEELLVKSRNRVAFAWTLVALCCGSHGSHILHSLGIHIAHGTLILICAVRCHVCNAYGISDFLLNLMLLGGFWDLLHNSYVKGGLAVGALLGPGRGLLLLF